MPIAIYNLSVAIRRTPGPKEYSHASRTGCVALRRNRITGRLVGIYHCGQAQIDGGDGNPWATICESHGHIIGHFSLALAQSQAADVFSWCGVCQTGDTKKP